MMDFIKELSQFSTATLHEALGQIGNLPYQIKPLSKNMKICGPAYTVKAKAFMNINLHRAYAKAGDVIVADCSGGYEAGYWGDLLTSGAMAQGIDPIALFQKYPKRIVIWHVKDMDKSKSAPIYTAANSSPAMADVFKEIKFAEVGTGTIDFKEIFKHKENMKYYFVEQDQITMPDKFASVKMSFDYINNHL